MDGDDATLVVAHDFAGLGAALAARVRPGRVVVVSNPVVAPLWAGPVLDSLRAAGFAPELMLVPDGEAHKTLDTWRALVEGLLAARVDRRTPVVALGGGVTTDLAGFAAATALRGLPLVNVPTTLLAMVDAALGGKTGVNCASGKNMVGAFYPAILVYGAMAALDTLPEAELRCGLGEVVKHGLLGDEALFALCEARAGEVRARDPDLLQELVRRSCAVKAAVVAADPLERGWRAVLNLGHTVGHAVEAALGFGALRHGEAVALGLLAETRFAAARGICAPVLPARLEGVLRALALPTAIPPQFAPIARSRALALAGLDKKFAGGTLVLPLVEGIGRARLVTIDAQELPSLFLHVTGLTED